MKRNGTIAISVGIVANLLLFFTKLYIGISSNSLSVYCDAINNLGDTLACGIGIMGFVLQGRMDEIKSSRTQSLCTFVINLIIAVTGGYFVYNGMERLLYPLPVSYSTKYAVLLIITIVIKILMGIMYHQFNKKEKSSVLGAMVLDSFLDCFITLTALASLFLITKIEFAVDGILAIVAGGIITISAIKSIIEQSKYLINN